jgi:hypothetical protein
LILRLPPILFPGPLLVRDEHDFARKLLEKGGWLAEFGGQHVERIPGHPFRQVDVLVNAGVEPDDDMGRRASINYRANEEADFPAVGCGGTRGRGTKFTRLGKIDSTPAIRGGPGDIAMTGPRRQLRPRCHG